MIGYYDHLNKDTPIRIEFENNVEIALVGQNLMEALVRAVRESNYGVHRLLSELVRQCRAEENLIPGYGREKLVVAIEAMLNEGGY